MITTENFDNVKVGDKIIYRNGSWYSEDTLSTVVKVTEKQFVDSHGFKFRKEDGRLIGTYHNCRRATVEDINAIAERDRRKSLIRNIVKMTESRNTLENFSTEDLESIYTLTKKYENKL